MIDPPKATKGRRMSKKTRKKSPKAAPQKAARAKSVKSAKTQRTKSRSAKASESTRKATKKTSGATRTASQKAPSKALNLPAPSFLHPRSPRERHRQRLLLNQKLPRHPRRRQSGP